MTCIAIALETLAEIYRNIGEQDGGLTETALGREKKMGVTSAVEWWGEWQLHVLALGSLVIQFLLTISAGFRTGSSQGFRFFIWLCYLGSDAVAIYALATLYNRQRYQQLQSSEHGTHGLQVFWAPILLVHLGGQVTISAYNLEDNELWRRHVVTALSQITVVLWVLYKSWGSPLDTKRLQSAAVLLFIAGILKCLEKPWALKSASFHSLANSCGPAKGSASREDELEKYVEQARAFVLSQDRCHKALLYAPEMLFTDFTYPYCDRLTNMKSFFMRGDNEAYKSLQAGLSNIFLVLYTRKKMNSFKDDNHASEECSSRDCFAATTWSLCFICLFLSYFLIGGHKNKDADWPMTAALLFGTGFIEHLAPKLMKFFEEEGEWPDTVAQHNVIGYFARNKRHAMLMRFARFFQCKDLLDQCLSMEFRYSAVAITKIVYQHVRDGWKEYIEDAESYREFKDMRGQWTLVRENCDENLGWSLEKPFDESILLWHMATDFCFHHRGTTGPGHECVSRSREISNYMMHLLFQNPDMLMAGSRSNLFKTAYAELEEILKGEETSCKREEDLLWKLSDKLKSNDVATETFIYDAWVLAERLMDLGDETKMWKVIEGVWVEMLCFSAGKCRGYLHAKCLGSGEEYLSYVWLLLAHTGMETFSERIQRTTSIRLLKHKREQRQSTRLDGHARSNSEGDGTVPTFDEIVVLP